MSTTVTVDPVTVITQLAENELTQAIVTAAKVSKKPRASKKTTVEVNEPSIIDEILINVASGKYAVEAAANLTRIFGREFESIAEQIVNMAADLPQDATIEITMPTQIKKDEVVTAKKPRAKKVKNDEAVTDAVADTVAVTEVVTEAPAKKPRAKKIKKDEVVADTVTVAVTEVVTEAPAKKPRAKKVKKDEAVTVVDAVADTVSDAITEVVTEAPAKKPRAKKAKDEVSSEVVAEAPAKKPRAKKIIVENDDDESVGAVAEVKPNKTKKIRSPTPVLVEEDEPANIENQIEIEDPELAGFAAEWGEELVEEELSDIEDDE